MQPVLPVVPEQRAHLPEVADARPGPEDAARRPVLAHEEAELVRRQLLPFRADAVAQLDQLVVHAPEDFSHGGVQEGALREDVEDGVKGAAGNDVLEVQLATDGGLIERVGKV